MAGQLMLCATPIGNLGDMTPRVIEALRKADLIAAEDTRNSLRLLNYFEIKTPMTSYHEHNQSEKAEWLVARLLEGKTVALITDAGTPAISDPGELLVRECHKAGITVTSLPGAAACITALTVSGLSTRRFCFEGFLPKEKKERREVLEELKEEGRTIVLYEAPHHLRATLSELLEVLDDRRITLCRELTKKFESVCVTTLREAVLRYEREEPRGEYVLVLEGKSRQQKKEEKQSVFLEMPLEAHMAAYEKQGITRKEAMKLVARDRGVAKRDIYRLLLEDKDANQEYEE
ncbi:MAG: 16S rRNA (cytidine(1402)-2'-O)-methyltransferase [Lachnospiraceae bacterium]|nr:16S rRNA (cytidine(1402)-2'-O)-methyltransferase [Lachnospiraceae bacterium]